MGLCKANLAKWAYQNDGDISCLFGQEQTMAHLNSCPCYERGGRKLTLLFCLLMQDCATLVRTRSSLK